MISILIVDNNLTFAIQLMNCINRLNDNIKVYGIVENEKKALNILNRKNNIDIILLNIKMSMHSVNELIELINDKEKYKKSIIIISEERQTCEISHNNMICSILDKCCDMKEIAHRINKLVSLKYRNENEYSIKNRIIDEILELNYDMSNIGTQYLISAIEYIILKIPNKEFNNLQTEVYPFIAEYNNTSIHNIKSNIVRATNKMYYQCEVEKLKEYFHYCYDTKPNTRTVIRTIINKVS